MSTDGRSEDDDRDLDGSEETRDSRKTLWWVVGLVFAVVLLVFTTWVY